MRFQEIASGWVSTGTSRPSPRNDIYLVPARGDVAPVEHGIVHGLGSIGAVGQGQQTVADLVAGGALLHMLPIAEGEFVCDLDTFITGEGNGPVGCVHPCEVDTTRIPLGE